MKAVSTVCVALVAWASGIAAPAAAFPAATNPAFATPAADVVKVDSVRRKPHRRRVDVPVPGRHNGPVSASGCPGLYSWNPANPDRG